MNNKSKLNDSQAAAVVHKDGPMVVLAGPGSGKTLVITQRTKYLIEQHGISPSQILVITFTKAAAGEMKERFHKLMEGVSAPVTFGTFHSIFFGILKQAYHLNQSNIAREEQRNQFLGEIIERLKLEIEDPNEFLQGIKSEISAVKNERIDLNYFYSSNCSEEVFRDIYHRYDRKMRQEKLLDFDDMLVYCYELFRERKDILQGWQKRFPYILIDEFQDINQIQYEIIKMLAAPLNNLFIVGDDDQSIYRFRGAKPEIILNFKKDYPNAKVTVLNINYRSTKEIVKASRNLISYNTMRYEKEIESYHGNGEKIEIQIFDHPLKECEKTAKHIRKLVEQGVSKREIAVLFRTNLGARLLVEKLMEYNIPFLMRDSIANLYEHWIAKNIFSYIKMAMGGRKRSDFLQIMNRPKRYLSRESLDGSEVNFQLLKQYYWTKTWMVERIEKLEIDLEKIKEMVPSSAIHYIRHGIGYEEYLKEYAIYRKMKVEELLEILDELEESAKPFLSFDQWFHHIEEYTTQLKEQKNQWKEKEECITLATLHSSKGLEFEHVFIIDINEGMIPYKKAILDSDMQEERRMFYVGMTRAKKNLSLYSVKEYNNKKMESSRFIGELLIGKEELVPGKKIIHVKYGEGVIKEIDHGKGVFYFPSKKKLITVDINYCISNQILKVEE